MGETWEQKRKLLLSLGTQTYRKPTELPLQFFDTFMGPDEDFLSCEIVFDSARNRLEYAENYVEPVESFAFVYSEKRVFVCGFPWPKKGSRLKMRDRNQSLLVAVYPSLDIGNQHPKKSPTILFCFQIDIIS